LYFYVLSNQKALIVKVGASSGVSEQKKMAKNNDIKKLL
jgi:hypothetical protein